MADIGQPNGHPLVERGSRHLRALVVAGEVAACHSHCLVVTTFSGGAYVAVEASEGGHWEQAQDYPARTT